MTEARGIRARSDGEALQAVRALNIGLPCELWQKDRLVMRIPTIALPEGKAGHWPTGMAIFS